MEKCRENQLKERRKAECQGISFWHLRRQRYVLGDRRWSCTVGKKLRF